MYANFESRHAKLSITISMVAIGLTLILLGCRPVEFDFESLPPKTPTEHPLPPSAAEGAVDYG